MGYDTKLEGKGGCQEPRGACHQPARGAAEVPARDETGDGASAASERFFSHDDEYFKRFARFFKALSDPTRLKILDLLRLGPLCVCEIEPHFKLSQAAISKHIKVLVSQGLLKLTPEGTRNVYSLAQGDLTEWIERIRPMFERTLFSSSRQV
ncbi:MAG: hypothetical protein Kow0069_24750 [Promethearchaeota archaeon]